MGAMKKATCLTLAAALLFVGCATTPDIEKRRQEVAADIDEILSLQLDPAEFGEEKRCLSDREYRSFRPLGDRHILFEGRRDNQWINTLRGRCPDLHRGDVLLVKSFSGTRMCDMDSFQVAELVPTGRGTGAGPGNGATSWNTGIRCSLGKFQPVLEDQVEEIEALLESL